MIKVVKVFLVVFFQTVLIFVPLSSVHANEKTTEWWFEAGTCSIDNPDTCNPGYYCEIREDENGSVLYATCQKDHCAEMNCPSCCLNYTYEGRCQDCSAECSSQYSTDCQDVEPECPPVVYGTGTTLRWTQKDRCLCIENFGTFFCGNMTVPCCVEKEKFCPATVQYEPAVPSDGSDPGSGSPADGSPGQGSDDGCTDGSQAGCSGGGVGVLPGESGDISRGDNSDPGGNNGSYPGDYIDNTGGSGSGSNDINAGTDTNVPPPIGAGSNSGNESGGAAVPGDGRRIPLIVE